VNDEELAVYGWALVADSGHGDCLGWHYDPETGRLVCACGVVLAEAEGAAA
jgi:hypothetical protein